MGRDGSRAGADALRMHSRYTHRSRAAAFCRRLRPPRDAVISGPADLTRTTCATRYTRSARRRCTSRPTKTAWFLRCREPVHGGAPWRRVARSCGHGHICLIAPNVTWLRSWQTGGRARFGCGNVRRAPRRVPPRRLDPTPNASSDCRPAESTRSCWKRSRTEAAAGFVALSTQPSWYM